MAKKRERSGASILKKAHPDSRYTGLVGTGRVIARSALRAMHDMVAGGSGMSGQTGRRISSRQQQIDDEVAILEGRRNAQTTDSNN